MTSCIGCVGYAVCCVVLSFVMEAFDMNTIAKYYCIPCLAKAELKAVLLDGSVSKGVFSFL